MKTLSLGFAKDHVCSVGIYNEEGYSVVDVSNFRKLVISQYGKEVGSSHVFSLDGYSSNGFVECDISVSSPPVLAICEFSRDRTADKGYLQDDKVFLINFYNLSEGVTEETLPISTYKIPGIHSDNERPSVCFVEDFKFAVLYPCKDSSKSMYKLSVVDLFGMRMIAETNEFQSRSVPWCLSVNTKYVAFMIIDEIKGTLHCCVYDMKLNLVNKFPISSENDWNQSISLTMDETEKVIIRKGHCYEVYDIKSGTIDFSLKREQIKLLMPSIIDDVHSCS